MCRFLRTLIVIAALCGFAACGSSSKSGTDYPVTDPRTTPGKVINTNPIENIKMGDLYDVVTKCDHGNRLYVYLGNGTIAVVPADPTCGTVTTTTTTTFP